MIVLYQPEGIPSIDQEAGIDWDSFWKSATILWQMDWL